MTRPTRERWLEAFGSGVYFLRNALLASTALAPALFVYAVVAVTESDYHRAAILASFAIGLWIGCDLWLERCVRRAPREGLNVTSVEAADNEALGLVLVYILPLITRDLDSFNFVAWIVIAVFLMIIVAVSYTYYFNPLLVVSGWHFYKVDTERHVKYILITKERKRDTGYMRVGKLTEYIYVDKGRTDDA